MADSSNIVTIRDIDVPFWRIVMILVKWSIASIPAMIILMLLLALIGAIVGRSAQPDRHRNPGSAHSARLGEAFRTTIRYSGGR